MIVAMEQSMVAYEEQEVHESISEEEDVQYDQTINIIR